MIASDADKKRESTFWGNFRKFGLEFGGNRLTHAF